MIVGGEYQWEPLPDGTYLIRDVEVFPTCVRRAKAPDGTVVTLDYDQNWIADALREGIQADADGHLYPLHIHHHGDPDNAPVEIGAVRLTREGVCVVKGEARNCLFADLIVTDPEAFQRIRGKRLRYRSVETSYAKRKIKSVSMLDHQPPFHELAMVTLAEEPENVTNGDAERMHAAGSAAAGVAFGADGSTHVVFDEGEQETQMAEIQSIKAGEKPNTLEVLLADGQKFTVGGVAPGESFEDDGGSDDEGGESSDSGMSLGDVDLSKISATAEEWAAFIAQAQEIASALGGGEAAAEDDSGAPADPVEPDAEAPAEVAEDDEPEEDEKMSDTTPDQAEKFAAMESKLLRLEREADARERADKIRTAVTAAAERLEGRAGTEDIEDELTKFADKHGVEAMEAHAETLERSLPALPVAGERFSDVRSGSLPEFVEKYRSMGPEAFSAAKELYREHDPKNCNGISAERYVALNIPGAEVPDDDPKPSASDYFAAPKRS